MWVGLDSTLIIAVRLSWTAGRPNSLSHRIGRYPYLTAPLKLAAVITGNVTSSRGTCMVWDSIRWCGSLLFRTCSHLLQPTAPHKPPHGHWPPTEAQGEEALSRSINLTGTAMREHTAAPDTQGGKKQPEQVYMILGPQMLK